MKISCEICDWVLRGVILPGEGLITLADGRCARISLAEPSNVPSYSTGSETVLDPRSGYAPRGRCCVHSV